jgi:hypothetical protein
MVFVERGDLLYVMLFSRLSVLMRNIVAESDLCYGSVWTPQARLRRRMGRSYTRSKF